MTSYHEAMALNKTNTRFGLSNKFELGYDPNGGSKTATASRVISKHGNRAGSMSVADNKQKFEKRDQSTNFNVQPVAVKL